MDYTDAKREELNKPKREGLGSQDDAQVHVAEVFLSAILILAAVLFAYSFELTSSPHERSWSQLRVLASDALEALDNIPNATGNSTLVEYIQNDDIYNLTNFLNQSLPDLTSYNIHLVNETLVKDIFIEGKPFAGAVVAHRLVLLNNAGEIKVYNLRIVAWYH